MLLSKGSCTALNVLHRFLIVFVVQGFLFINTVTANDTTFDERWLNAQLATAEQKSIQDPGDAIVYLTDLLSKHEKELNVLLRTQLQIYLAENHILVAELSKATALDKQISNNLPLLSDESLISHLLVKSNIYNFEGKPDKAINVLEEAKSKVDKLSNNKLKSKVYSKMASHYVDNEKDILAIRYYSKSYELILKSGDFLQLAYIQSSMAQSYEHLFDYERAVELQKKSLNYFLSHNLSFDAMVSYYHLANVYLKLSRNEEAIHCSEEMLKLNSKVINANLAYYAYIIAAEAYINIQKVDQANYYLNLSNDHFGGLENVNNIVRHFYIQAEIEIKSGKLTQAEETLERAQKSVVGLSVDNKVSLKLKLTDLKSQLASEKSNYKQAYNYQKTYNQLNTEYFDKVRELTRSRHKIQFDLKQMELEKQLLRKDKELNEFTLQEIKRQQAVQQTAMLSVLLLFLFVLIFTWRQYRLRRKFSLLANTDFLTGVANRRKVMDFAELQWLQLKSDNQKLSLISFDLDHFKKINDNYGHPAGDLVLKVVTQISQRAIRESDFLGRIGGEEFLVVLNNTTSVEATEIAFRIKSDIEKEHIISDGQIIKITASFGVAQKSSELTSFKDLLKKADKALYTAKEHGRNRVEINE
ncbi:diguanylate cyclase [Pseudoalteromonas sp. NEC-BIFX-2020_015]|uniref:tetratricopeptide repeat-containing diguanylate cyclase n=1 Tax=Pseudoalteromonas sp. NEC-BIFX-2020_015 TaxID=2729544 RepID=UPI00146159F6|nr:GGDEF domain-containing protein [Pseudoalteromonas sp. NEC-BIFX-2020_015]NMR24807.1 diguanylate cyclase [Pseudoalteromonas sp. NEC-BIFX-2020_015]